MNSHKCGFNNCNKYVGKNYKCFMKKIKLKVVTARLVVRNLARITIQLKKKDWCYSCRTYTEKFIFYGFAATQNTGTHTVNLSIAQDFEGKEYIHNSIEEFCKCFLNDKFKGHTLIAHNSKGYGSHFVLKWLINQGINPISTGWRCFPRKFCLPVDNFFSFESIATKFGDFS